MRRDEAGEDQPVYWLSLEALQSRTGGTREDKLRRLGEKEYVIDDSLDMLVCKENFDRQGLLLGIRELIRISLGDPDPVLIESELKDFPGAFSLAGEPVVPHAVPRQTKLLFVYHASRLNAPTPDSVLPRTPTLEVRSAGIDDSGSLHLGASDLAWPDVIVVMDKKVRSAVHRRCKALGLDKRVVCLYLSEQHDIADPPYAEAVVERLRVYLHRMGISNV